MTKVTRRCGQHRDLRGKRWQDAADFITNSYPSKEALDANAGMMNAQARTFEQLDELLVTPGRERGTVIKLWASSRRPHKSPRRNLETSLTAAGGSGGMAEWGVE